MTNPKSSEKPSVSSPLNDSPTKRCSSSTPVISPTRHSQSSLQNSSSLDPMVSPNRHYQSKKESHSQSLQSTSTNHDTVTTPLKIYDLDLILSGLDEVEMEVDSWIKAPTSTEKKSSLLSQLNDSSIQASASSTPVISPTRHSPSMQSSLQNSSPLSPSVSSNRHSQLIQSKTISTTDHRSNNKDSKTISLYHFCIGGGISEAEVMETVPTSPLPKPEPEELMNGENTSIYDMIIGGSLMGSATLNPDFYYHYIYTRKKEKSAVIIQTFIRGSLAKLQYSQTFLSELGAFYASRGNWSAAVKVFQNLIMQCEHRRIKTHHHPFIMASYLDLAGVFLQTGDEKSALIFINRARNNLDIFLRAHEKSCGSYHDRIVRSESEAADSSIDAEDTNEALKIFESMINDMRFYMGRSMLKVLSSDHPIFLLSLCFIADALVVFATCEELMYKTTQNSSTTMSLVSESWVLAGEHYREALVGWISSYGAIHPNVPAAATGLARCLHKTRQASEAMKVLISIIDSIQDIHQNVSSARNALELAMKSASHHAVANCLWMLATYSSENSNSIEGQKQALRYLHAASEELRMIDPEHMSESDLTSSVEMRLTIEHEAKLVLGLTNLRE